MRQTYRLSDETRAVLTDYVKPISEEMNKSDKYIYAFLSESQTDLFAKFLPLYAAAVRAGAPVCHWDNRLAGIRARYEKINPGKNPAECLTEKIHIHAETTARLVEALSDGKLDEREIKQLRLDIEKERKNLNLLEMILNFQETV